VVKTAVGLPVAPGSIHPPRCAGGDEAAVASIHRAAESLEILGSSTTLGDVHASYKTSQPGCCIYPRSSTKQRHLVGGGG
jgi:hypothetical protein